MSEAAGERTLRAEAERYYRRNFVVLLIHGLLGQTGFRMIHAPTFIPAYVFMISGSEFVVGVARAVQAFGQFLSPILSASLVEHRRRALPTALWVGAAMRVQILGIALAGFFLAPSANVVAVCVFLGMFGFFLGMQGVLFNVLFSKVVPLERRGWLQGLRNALGSLAGVLVGGIGGTLLARETLGNGYATVFLVSFVLTALGLALFMMLKEPDSPAPRTATPLRERFSDLLPLLREDPAFARYLVARSLGVMGRMAMPFYIIMAKERLGFSGEEIGELTVAFVAAQGALNLGFGSIADRRGFRATLLLALVVWMASALLLLDAHSYRAVLVAFVGLGAGLGGFMMSAQSLVLEFGSRADLPMRIAVANSASEAVGIAAPLLGGLLAAQFGYEVLIAVTVGFQALAFLVTWRFVDEPRHRPDASA